METGSAGLAEGGGIALVYLVVLVKKFFADKAPWGVDNIYELCKKIHSPPLSPDAICIG
jgi:hypothetical protein